MELVTPSYEPAHFLVRFVVGKPNEYIGGRYIDIVGFKQWASFSCGFAATSMVMSHYRPEADLQKLYEQLGTNETGTRQNSIVNTLRGHGLSVLIKRSASFNDLTTAIDSGKLIIIYDFDREHWMTVYGYQKNGLILVADPAPCDEYKWPWMSGEPFNSFALIISEKGRKNVVSI